MEKPDTTKIKAAYHDQLLPMIECSTLSDTILLDSIRHLARVQKQELEVMQSNYNTAYATFRKLFASRFPILVNERMIDKDLVTDFESDVWNYFEIRLNLEQKDHYVQEVAVKIFELLDYEWLIDKLEI